MEIKYKLKTLKIANSKRKIASKWKSKEKINSKGKIYCLAKTNNNWNWTKITIN